MNLITDLTVLNENDYIFLQGFGSFDDSTGDYRVAYVDVNNKSVTVSMTISPNEVDGYIDEGLILDRRIKVFLYTKEEHPEYYL